MRWCGGAVVRWGGGAGGAVVRVVRWCGGAVVRWCGGAVVWVVSGGAEWCGIVVQGSAG